MRVFGKVKAQVLLGFSVAAFNIDRVRAFRARMRANEEPKTRAKRRRGTWAEVVEQPATTVEGTAAPPS